MQLPDMDRNLVIAPGINLPPLLFKQKVVIINYSKSDGSLMVGGDEPVVVRKQFPLTFKAPGLKPFQFPIDPFISVSFKNIITRRSVAKGDKRGTVKERWTEDDAEINISGVLIADDDHYPDDVFTLQKYFETRQAIGAECRVLNDLGITSIVIESFDLPFTKGVENQAFTIKAYSDDVFNLLIEN